MRFFNDETIKVDFLDEVLHQGCYSVTGLGKGCAEALEFVFTCKERIDTLQLVFPSFELQHEKLLSVKQKGVEIEVYLQDEKLKQGFLPYSTIYFIKENKK